MLRPQLRCVLQHWYELRPQGQVLGSENNKRYVGIKALKMVLQRRGKDALRGEIFRAARSESMAEPAHLVVGAGFFPDDVLVETFVRKALSQQNRDFRIAATYASSFFLQLSREVVIVLSERVLLGEGDALVLQASQEALTIGACAHNGDLCSLCSSRGTSRETDDWVPWRAVR